MKCLNKIAVQVRSEPFIEYQSEVHNHVEEAPSGPSIRGQCKANLSSRCDVNAQTRKSDTWCDPVRPNHKRSCKSTDQTCACQYPGPNVFKRPCAELMGWALAVRIVRVKLI